VFELFRLVTGFVGLLQLVTMRTIWIYRVYNSLWHALSLLCQLCLLYSSGNGFHQRTFPFLWIPEQSLCLKHSNSRLSPKQLQLSQEDLSRVTFCTPFKKAVTSKFLLSNKTSYLQLLGVDRTENTIPYCCVTRTMQKTPFFCCVEHSYLATAIFYKVIIQQQLIV
jgi:hypothetical protein